MKGLLAVLFAGGTAAAVVLALYLPERSRRVEAEARCARVAAELEEARSLLLVHAIHDRVLDLVEVGADPAGHEQAQAQSTRFFDQVRDAAGRVAEPEVRAALAKVLARRDSVTAALARRDPAVRALLGEIRKDLRPLLGEPGVPAPAPAP